MENDDKEHNKKMTIKKTWFGSEPSDTARNNNDKTIYGQVTRTIMYCKPAMRL